jgi:hypothetical protein
MEACVGDTVETYWRDAGRHDIGTIEKAIPISVTLRIVGPPEITIVMPAEQLRKSGPHRWKLEL